MSNLKHQLRNKIKNYDAILYGVYIFILHPVTHVLIISALGANTTALLIRDDVSPTFTVGFKVAYNNVSKYVISPTGEIVNSRFQEWQ